MKPGTLRQGRSTFESFGPLQPACASSATEEGGTVQRSVQRMLESD